MQRGPMAKWAPLALAGALAALPCGSAKGEAALVKCVDAKGRVTYGNDPQMACPNRKELDPERLGSGMSMPAPARAAGGPKAGQGHAGQARPAAEGGAAPEAPLDRMARALGGKPAAAAPAPDPTDKALEQAVKQ